MPTGKHARLGGRSLYSGALLAAALFFGLSLSATTITYNFNNEFSSGTPPAGAPPWLSAVFTDSGTDHSLAANSVSLTLSTPDFTGSEFVSGWYFNLNPALESTIGHLTFTTSGGTFTPPTIQTGVDAFKADGDGKYDILFSFATSGGAPKQFTAGDVLTVIITDTSVSSLSSSDFAWLSAPSGGHGPFYSAAHVQGIGATGGLSGWVEPSGGPVTTGGSPGGGQVPDGSATIVLLGVGLLAIEGARRKLHLFRH